MHFPFHRKYASPGDLLRAHYRGRNVFKRYFFIFLPPPATKCSHYIIQHAAHTAVHGARAVVYTQPRVHCTRVHGAACLFGRQQMALTYTIINVRKTVRGFGPNEFRVLF